MPKNKNIFPFNRNLECICRVPDGCICSHDECTLRNYIAKKKMPPMNQEQRNWCIKEVVRCWEAGTTKEEAEESSDEQLARYTIEGWIAYVDSMF